jgi:predicted acetyltransferase
MPQWCDRIGASNLRLARRGSEIVGGLGLVPMGHWLGGCSVPCVGVTAVAVAPEHRSRGIAAELLRTALEEVRRDGVALSSLFPATYPVYRAAGYESAANRLVYRIPLTSVGAGAREVPALDGTAAGARSRLAQPDIREATADDHPTLRALYDARAKTAPGQVDRTRYFWVRIHEPASGEDARAYIVEGDAGPEGYVVVWYKAGASPLAANELTVRDLVARTPGAARRILRFLADHRSIVAAVHVAAGPGDPVLMQLREERLTISDVQRCMVRVVDVRAALERRGWSPALRGEVHLDVRDPLLRENARRYVLEVSGGRAEVREGGSGAVAMDVRGLAALTTGYLGAEELCVAGLCDGADADLAHATALFAGPAPWLTDHY